MEYLKYIIPLLKNKVTKHILIALAIGVIFTFGRDSYPIKDMLNMLETSNMNQLKLILKQTEVDRDLYKKQAEELDKELAKLSGQKDKLSSDRVNLKTKIAILEKKLKESSPTYIIPSTDKKELAKQFTTLGFEAGVRECK